MGFAEQSREKVATDCGDGLRVGREELGQAAPGGRPGGHRREVPLSSDMQTVDRLAALLLTRSHLLLRLPWSA